MISFKQYGHHTIYLQNYVTKTHPIASIFDKIKNEKNEKKFNHYKSINWYCSLNIILLFIMALSA
jgi:hypothetical protein